METDRNVKDGHYDFRKFASNILRRTFLGSYSTVALMFLPRQFHQEGDWKGLPFDLSACAQAFGQEAHAETIDEPTTYVVW